MSPIMVRMDQFRANLRAFERAVLPRRDGETPEALVERARALVPYPDNEMWEVAVRGWATARASGSA